MPHQSSQASLVAPLTDEESTNMTGISFKTLHILKSEYIPGPVANLLDQWFQAHPSTSPPGAVTVHYARYADACWIPSSNRTPEFLDCKGQKLMAQLYSLKKTKWMGNGRHIVLVVWNDAQPPVIVKDFLDGLGPKFKNEPPTSRLSCRVWKGRSHDTTRAGFLRYSVVFLVKHDEERPRAKNILEEVPPSNSNACTMNSPNPVFPSPALLTHDQVRKSKPDNMNIAHQDPREALRNLHPKLRVILEDYYDKNGTRQAPIYAYYEKALSFAIDVDCPIILHDSRGSKVPVERFPTGFKGYVFLVAKGEIIITNGTPGTSSRNYIAWYGGELFKPVDLYDYSNNGALATELARTLDPGRTQLSSQNARTDATDRVPVSSLPNLIFPAFLIDNFSTDDVRLVQNIMHKNKSLPPTTKTSLRESIDLTNLPEHKSLAPLSRRQRLNSSEGLNDTLISQSRPTTCSPTRVSESNHHSSKASTLQATTFTTSNSDGSRARELDLNSSTTPLNLPSTYNDEYIENHVELHFLSGNGLEHRKRPLALCNKLTGLFLQARRAFAWVSTKDKILLIDIPGVKKSCAIAKDDQEDFNDFMRILKDAAQVQLKRNNGQSLTLEVSEMVDQE